MPPKKHKAVVGNNIEKLSPYKKKLRPRRMKEPAAQPSSSSPNKSRQKKMPSKTIQAALQRTTTKSGTRSPSKNKRSAPPLIKETVSSKKRKVASVVKKASSQRKKRPPPPSQKLSNIEKQKYSFKVPYPQQYSFPGNIIFYAARNPLFPAGHLKLLKSCKALFRMSRIVPVEDFRKQIHYFNASDVDKWVANNAGETVDLKNQFFKLWIYDKLSITEFSKPDLSSTLVKRIHLCSLRKLTLEHQHLTFNELEIFIGSGKLEKINFDKNVIRNVDGSITEFGKVFDALCCRNMIIYLPDQQNGFTKVTAKKIVEVLESEKAALDVCVRLMNIPEAFEFQAITGFLKANMDQEKHTIDLEFTENLSDPYKNSLQKYINEIIKIRGIYAHTLPIIRFYEQDRPAWGLLHQMRYGDVDGIRKKPGTDRVRRRRRQVARMSTGGQAPRR